MNFLNRKNSTDDRVSATGSSGNRHEAAKSTRCGILSLSSRIAIVIAALMLSFTYFFPLWEITLDAPQYPEGLGLEIWINQMQGQHPGDLNKINNLNHYIGMKQIKPESIAELSIMPWIMRGLLLVGLFVAAMGRRSLLLVWLLLFLTMAMAGFVDFYLWGYDYGHNLDTQHAIIKVPGMSYQPPLFGSKKLLNFKAISLPGIGGWLAMVSFSLGGLVWLYELRRARRLAVVRDSAGTAVIACLLLSLAVSCSQPGPLPIEYGVDQCDYCKMTIADNKFGAELVTTKGKIYKYDSIECLAASDLETGTAKQVHSRWVTDFAHPAAFLDVSRAVLVATERQKSPMGVGLVAVSTKLDAEALIRSVGGSVVDWNGVHQLVAETWKLTGDR